MQLLNKLRRNKLQPPPGRAGKLAIRLVELLLVIALAQQLSGLFWQLEAEQATLPVVPPAAVQQTTSVAKQAYANLNQFAPFGRAVQPVAQAINPDTVPRSRLKLRVTGIMASPQVEHSLAIVRGSAGEAVYRIGDTIKGSGVTVADIYTDRLILRAKGRHEALLLYPDQPDSAARRMVKSAASGKDSHN